MSKTALVALLVLLNTSLVSPPSQADSIRYFALNYTSPQIVVPACKPFPYGQNVVQIYLDLTSPAKSFRFTGPSGYNLSSTVWEYAVAGDEGATQTLDFGGCVNGSILLGTATYDVEYGECQALIKGDPEPTGWTLPVVVGCDDVERITETACAAAPPTLLSPVDGALNVSLTPTLTWTLSAGETCIEGIGIYTSSLYVGTSPETLVSVGNWHDSLQWQLQNPLLPEATYYWRVKMLDHFYEYQGANIRFSPIHSFTTGGSVAVEEISWSTFKRHYRE